MREFRSYGSARGAAGNSRPYRERRRPRFMTPLNDPSVYSEGWQTPLSRRLGAAVVPVWAAAPESAVVVAPAMVLAPAVVSAVVPAVLARPLALPFSSAGEKDAGTLRSLCVFKVEGTRAPACCPHVGYGGEDRMGQQSVCIHSQMSMECGMGPHH